MKRLTKNLTSNLSYPALQPEHYDRMLFLVALLVLLLHVSVFLVYKQSAQPQPVSAQVMPFKLEVSMIPEPEAKPSAAAHTPELKPQPKEKEKPKPVTEKKPPEAQKPEDFASLKQLIENQPHKEVARSVQYQPDSRSVKAVSSTLIHPRPKKPNAIDNFPESDEHNVSPEYPDEAAFLGYQGTAVIKINVSAKGMSSGVELLHSSGHKMLDDSAAKALKLWKFTPTHQPDSVIIVVNYILR
ncbi:TonB family protein [Methylomonas sp. AM2-LC]|uniref:energy transducer TonB n=1 Tax=Methylomonas sp. AM2-LC TaxID=3153301 RepID=UPI003263374F